MIDISDFVNIINAVLVAVQITIKLYEIYHR